jgi:hypothetical protein
MKFELQIGALDYILLHFVLSFHSYVRPDGGNLALIAVTTPISTWS